MAFRLATLSRISSNISRSAVLRQASITKTFIPSRYSGLSALNSKDSKGTSIYPAILRSAFGTFEIPAIVPAYEPTRIIGCVGLEDDEHPILWHEVREGRLTVCLECGQVFKLQRLVEQYKDTSSFIAQDFIGKTDPTIERD
eukprot:TRINITY_DN5038_c0_g2_i1.p1 TRINITY_DN5038_c0_g2~~TRINITY_DN5038_c0_g2_i1.p1  ORF type:complete len:142 (+),score=77.97 TRINITY_DN5038_c0_g2_i1:140-565(+)